jgi:hypothetical protein
LKADPEAVRLAPTVAGVRGERAFL